MKSEAKPYSFVWTAALLLAVLAAARPDAANAQASLSFNGTNGYVTFGNAAELGLSTFTLETWFRRDGTGTITSTGTGGITTFVPLVTKGAGQADGSNVDANYLLGINTTGNVIAADFEEGAAGSSPGLNHPISGVTPIVNGVWYHAAASYDGTTWRLYLNGILESELVVGQPVRSDSIQHAGLGTTLTSTGTASGFFNGVLDEVRIWNTARSASDIRANIDAELTSGTGLVARWGLDEGAGTAVADSVGTPTNGTITGAGFAWAANAPFDLALCQNLENQMLRFDGTNDYVTFGDPAELDLATFTVETWFNRSAAGTSNTTGTGGITIVPLVTKGAPQAEMSNVDANFIFGINTTGNVIAADFEEGALGASPGLNHPVSGVTPIVNNTWYHAAATYDGTTWRLYLNGALEVSLVVGQPVRSDSIQRAGLATMIRSDDTTAGFFAGTLDEVRIWNVARSQAEIQADYQKTLTSGTGLVARWGLDAGTGTSAVDSVGSPASNGTLTNGPVWVHSNTLFSKYASCDDALFCNGGDTCDSATLRCGSHAGDPCAGGSECNNSCNEAADSCADAAGSACTADGNACTDDVCDGAGTCGVANTAPCDDGQFCNGADVCGGGVCGHAGDPCVGGSECNDACNEAADSCADAAGSACTADVNVCTDDVCDGAGACGVANTAPCDDGLFCTGADVCSGGVCGHAGDPCVGGSECNDSCNEGADSCSDLPGIACSPDGNVCTDDVCDGAGACGVANTASCDDGQFCNGADTCSGGACGSHAGDPCVGGSECNDACNEGADDCADLVGSVCTPDANVCTDDVCNGAGTCGNPNTASCDDGNACTSEDVCSAGGCAPGTPVTVCNNGDGCCPAGCHSGNDDDCVAAEIPLYPPLAGLLIAGALGYFSARPLRRRDRRQTGAVD